MAQSWVSQLVRTLKSGQDDFIIDVYSSSYLRFKNNFEPAEIQELQANASEITSHLLLHLSSPNVPLVQSALKFLGCLFHSPGSLGLQTDFQSGKTLLSGVVALVKSKHQLCSNVAVWCCSVHRLPQESVTPLMSSLWDSLFAYLTNPARSPIEEAEALLAISNTLRFNPQGLSLQVAQHFPVLYKGLFGPEISKQAAVKLFSRISLKEQHIPQLWAFFEKEGADKLYQLHEKDQSTALNVLRELFRIVKPAPLFQIPSIQKMCQGTFHSEDEAVKLAAFAVWSTIFKYHDWKKDIRIAVVGQPFIDCFSREETPATKELKLACVESWKATLVLLGTKLSKYVEQLYFPVLRSILSDSNAPVRRQGLQILYYSICPQTNSGEPPNEVPCLPKNILEGNTKAFFGLVKTSLIFQLRLLPNDEQDFSPEGWIANSVTGNQVLSSDIFLIWSELVKSLVKRKYDAEMLQDPLFLSSFWELMYFLADISATEPSKIYPRKAPLESLFHFQVNLGKKVILHHDLVLLLIDHVLQAFSQKAELSSPTLTAKEPHKLLSEVLEKPYRPMPIAFLMYLLLQSPGIIMHSAVLRSRFISFFRTLTAMLFVGDEAVENTNVLLQLMKAGVGPLVHNLEMVFALWSTLMEVFISVAGTSETRNERSMSMEAYTAILSSFAAFPFRYLSESPHPDLGTTREQSLVTWKTLCSLIIREKEFPESLLQHLEGCLSNDGEKALQTSFSALEFLCGSVAIIVDLISAPTLAQALISKPISSKKRWKPTSLFLILNSVLKSSVSFLTSPLWNAPQTEMLATLSLGILFRLVSNELTPWTSLQAISLTSEALSLSLQSTTREPVFAGLLSQITNRLLVQLGPDWLMTESLHPSLVALLCAAFNSPFEKVRDQVHKFWADSILPRVENEEKLMANIAILQSRHPLLWEAASQQVWEYKQPQKEAPASPAKLPQLPEKVLSPLKSQIGAAAECPSSPSSILKRKRQISDEGRPPSPTKSVKFGVSHNPLTFGLSVRRNLLKEMEDSEQPEEMREDSPVFVTIPTPQPEPVEKPSSDEKPEPASSSEPTVIFEPTSDSEPEGDSEPEHEPEGDSERDSEGDSEGDSEPESDSEPMSEPEPEPHQANSPGREPEAPRAIEIPINSISGGTQQSSDEVSTVAPTPSEKMVFAVIMSRDRFRRDVIQTQDPSVIVHVPETPAKDMDLPRSSRRTKVQDASNEGRKQPKSKPGLGVLRNGKPRQQPKTQPQSEALSEEESEGELGELPVVEIPVLKDESSESHRLLSKMEFLSALNLLLGNVNLLEKLSSSHLAGVKEKLEVLTQATNHSIKGKQGKTKKM